MQALRRKMELDSLGEELRVLYVAMTRPQEKLILTGSCKEEENSQYSRCGWQRPVPH